MNTSRLKPNNRRRGCEKIDQVRWNINGPLENTHDVELDRNVADPAIRGNVKDLPSLGKMRGDGKDPVADRRQILRYPERRLITPRLGFDPKHGDVPSVPENCLTLVMLDPLHDPIVGVSGHQ